MKQENLRRIIIILVTILIVYPPFIIYQQYKKINELSLIEKPFYSSDIIQGFEYKYFNYAGVEFSSNTKEDEFYGCDLTQNQKQMAVYCNINKKVCKVETINSTCLMESNLNLTEGIPLNSLGCINIYELNGNFSKRTY